MAYTVPTAASLKARYPEFDAVSDDLVTLVITEAAGTVTTSWLERDYPIAIMLLAAHMLIAEGAVERADPNGDGTSTMTTTGAVKSFRVSEVQMSYAGTGGGAGGQEMSADALASTYYGARFLALRRANFSGPLVA
jgi:hypothetical protein